MADTENAQTGENAQGENDRGKGNVVGLPSDRRTAAYQKSVGDALDPETERVLIDYSGLPEDKIQEHIHKVRDEAWDVYPYPCIGQWRFLELSIAQNPVYDEVLQRVKDGQKLLDVGCCVGQDLRKLAKDGAPSANLAGTDVQGGFFGIGYNLFLDKDKFEGQFYDADMFKFGESDCSLTAHEGEFDMIHASAFFHLFDWNIQKKAAINCLKLLKRQKGSMVFGRHSGTVTAGVKGIRVAKHNEDAKAWSRWGHDEDSWKKLWEEVGEATGTKWSVDVEAKHAPNWGDKYIEDRTRMKYCVRLVEV